MREWTKERKETSDLKINYNPHHHHRQYFWSVFSWLGLSKDVSASCFEKNRVLNAISFRISFKAFHMAEIFQRRTSFLAPARIIKFLLLSPPINLSVSWGWRCSGPVNIFLGVKPDNCKYLLQAGSKRQYHNNNCHLSWRVIDSMMFPYRRLSLMAFQHITSGQLGNTRQWWA